MSILYDSSSAIDSRRNTLNQLLERMRDTNVDDQEGRALARLFYKESRAEPLRAMFTYALSVPRFASWFAAVREDECEDTLLSAISNDTADEVRKRLMEYVTLNPGGEPDIRARGALRAVFEEKDEAWEVFTDCHLDSFGVSTAYLETAMTPTAPQRVFEHAGNLLVYATVNGSLPVSTAMHFISMCQRAAENDDMAFARIARLLLRIMMHLIISLEKKTREAQRAAQAKPQSDPMALPPKKRSREASSADESDESDESEEEEKRARKPIKGRQPVYSVVFLREAVAKTFEATKNGKKMTLATAIKILNDKYPNIFSYTNSPNVSLGQVLKKAFGDKAHYQANNVSPVYYAIAVRK